MLKKKPANRFNAEECLAHEFFADMPKEDDEVKVDLSHLKELNNNVMNNFDKDKNSFVVRDNVINGKLDTINETDSKGGITSFK